MLVYSDRSEREDPRQRAREIDRLLEQVETMQPGLQRHSRLVSALVQMGQLLQGLADSEFDLNQVDRRGTTIDELGTALQAAARAFCRSWHSGFAEIGSLPRVHVHPNWPAEVSLRVAEGFAYYGVFPEAYVEAARRLTLVAPPQVIAIRSVGTTLGAVVSAELDAPPAVTVRPFGRAFDRRIRIDPQLERELLQSEFHYVIVDEGPGQSGSSFGSVGEWRAERGVPLERIALLPSHPGSPGPAATERRRCWWRSVQREVGDFGERLPELVGRWSSELIGALDEPPIDISGGAWRDLLYSSELEWPGVVPTFERRKFLLRAQGQSFVAKFAGLGRVGEDKLAVSRALGCEGLVPEAVGLVHGFIIEPWCSEASPLGPGEEPTRDIARYVAARARLLPASSGSGASASDLLGMARRNVALELGDQSARALDRWESRTADLDRRIVRVRTDNRLDRHEWLLTRSGALTKTDALDHHQAHDLVGCQDIAWDCAGAISEFELDQFKAERLLADVAEWSGFEIDRELLQFYRIAYLAFRLGEVRLGATTVSAAAEQQRLRRRGDRHALELQHLLESSSAATRPESLVG